MAPVINVRLRGTNSPAPYAEDQLIEQPALGLLAEQDWQRAITRKKPYATSSPGVSLTQ